jgi:hypothetical protein
METEVVQNTNIAIMDSWISPWLSHLLLYGVEIWSVPGAAHVGSTDWNRYCPLFPNFPP